MQFTIEQKQLQKELTSLQGVVDNGSTTLALSYILVESEGLDKVRFTGTDLDVTVSFVTDAKVKTEGRICINGQKLFGVVKTLEEGNVKFMLLANGSIGITSGKAKFRIPTIDPDSFPALPKLQDTPLVFDASLFVSFIAKTTFAITNEESRFSLSGASFTLKDGLAKMVTTDGHRLVYVEDSWDNSEDFLDVLIPKKALSQLSKISKIASDSIEVGSDLNHIYFKVDNIDIVARRLSGAFPNYEAVLPDNLKYKVTVNKSEFKAVINRVSQMVNVRTRVIKLFFSEDNLNVLCQSATTGEATEDLKVDYDGDDVTILFDVSFLKDFIHIADTEKITLEFSKPNGQMQFGLDGDTVLRYILMPLRN